MTAEGEEEMVEIVLGVLLIIAIVWHIQSKRYGVSRRLNLESYIIYLLMDDRIREDHRHKFCDWIKQVNATDAAHLGLMAHATVADMADSLSAGGSLLAANAMVWRHETQS
jgi:hypothetical protein